VWSRIVKYYQILYRTGNQDTTNTTKNVAQYWEGFFKFSQEHLRFPGEPPHLSSPAGRCFLNFLGNLARIPGVFSLVSIPAQVVWFCFSRVTCHPSSTINVAVGRSGWWVGVGGLCCLVSWFLM